MQIAARVKRTQAIGAVRNRDYVRFRIRSPAQARDPGGIWTVLLFKSSFTGGAHHEVEENSFNCALRADVLRRELRNYEPAKL